MNFFTAILLCVTILPVSTAKERRLLVEFDDVSARASALVEAVDNMQADLREQGLTPPRSSDPSIAASRPPRLERTEQELGPCAGLD